jgi:HEAT repeat protein
VEQTALRPQVGRHDSAPEKTDAKPAQETPSTTPAPGETASASGADSPTGRDVYQHVLKSTVWIVVPNQDGSAMGGTGTLIDRGHKWVLTNFHVVAGATNQILVFFPVHKDGKLLAERDAYLKQTHKEDLIYATVLIKEEKRDLALLELNRLPDNAQALPIARGQVTPGEAVHSLGNPGQSGALWVYTSGTVRQVYHKKWEARGGNRTYQMDAQVVETQSPTNPGDSGGPLVNDRGELVGVTHGGAIFAQALSLFIDLSEVNQMVDGYAQSHSTTWVRDDRHLAGHATASVPDLIRNLESTDAKARAKAAETLGDKGPEAKPAVRALLKVVNNDNDDLVRRLAQEALDKIGAPDKVELSFLRDALQSARPQARAYAAAALGQIGSEARSAVPDLLKVIKDSEASVRQQATRSLGRIGADSKETVFPSLQEALKDKDANVRVAAAEAIAASETLASSDVPLLLEMLKHKDMEAQAHGARGLGRLARHAKAAVPALREAFKSPDRGVRRAALEALARCSTEAADVIPTFVEALQDANLSVRKDALQELAKFGPAAKAAVPDLAIALSHENKDIRKGAAVALAKIGPDAQGAVKALTERLREEEDRNIRLEVLATFGALGPAAKAAVPDLIQFLYDNRDKEVHNKAAFALGRIGKDGLKQLKLALSSDNFYVRVGAALALGQMGPEAKSASKLLAAHAKADLSFEVQQACRAALDKVLAK